jgi:hypothetical protein
MGGNISIQNISRGYNVNVRYFEGGGREVKCHLLNFVVKSANGWIVQGGKVYFP